MLINHLVYEIEIEKNFPKPQGDVFKLLILANQQSKSSDVQFTITKDTEMQLILKIEKLELGTV